MRRGSQLTFEFDLLPGPATIIEPGGPRYSTGPKNCTRCGVTFRAKRAIDLAKVYCSKACYHAEQRDRLADQYHFQCEVCGKAFRDPHPNRPHQFCSKACRGLSERKRAKVTCPECGKEFETRLYRGGKRTYCSHKCSAVYRGRVFGHGLPKNPHRATRPTPYERAGYIKLAGKIRKRDGYRCQDCGKQFVKGSRSLEVHHKMPIRSGGTDEPDNLISLCVKCHRRVDVMLRKQDGLIPA